jgi:predicted transposase/invertase (TIGR01784 family)
VSPELPQKKEFINLKAVSEIFPEYYILKVNGFDDIAKDTLDEWIYFLKNSDIKSEFKAKGLKKASVELDVMKLSKEDREEYDSYIEERRVTESSVKTSWLEGKNEGKIEGIIEGKIEVARNLKLAGVAVDLIVQATGLSKEEIETA